MCGVYTEIHFGDLIQMNSDLSGGKTLISWQFFKNHLLALALGIGLALVSLYFTNYIYYTITNSNVAFFSCLSVMLLG